MFILNVALLILNTDLSDRAPVSKRNSYVHLVLFNAASVVLSKSVTHVIAHAFDVVGGELEASHVLSATFFACVYRTTFLSLDSLYYAYTNSNDGNKHCAFIDSIKRGEKVIIVKI